MEKMDNKQQVLLETKDWERILKEIATFIICAEVGITQQTSAISAVGISQFQAHLERNKSAAVSLFILAN